MAEYENLRNLWYLNINSTNGIAIGKCGYKGSNLTDLDITAGLVTASHQLSSEMVSTEEKTKYNIENVKGGSKRVRFYSDWANELSALEKGIEIPTITSMLQISGPEMETNSYNKIIIFLKRLNDEIIFRYMLGELVPERTMDPFIHIDILSSTIKQFNKDGTSIIGNTSLSLDKIVKTSLEDLFDNNTFILSLFLSKIPLDSTINQDLYVERVNSLKKYIKKQIYSFLRIEKELTIIRESKIYSDDLSFNELRRRYSEYSDEEESYIQKKHAASVALEHSNLILEEILSNISSSSEDEFSSDLYIIREKLPKTEDYEDYIGKIKDTSLENSGRSLLDDFEKLINIDIKGLNTKLIKKGIVHEKDSKQSYENLNKLKTEIFTFIELTRNILESKNSNKLKILAKRYKKIITSNSLLKKKKAGDKFIENLEIDKSNIDPIKIKKSKIEQADNYLKYVKQNIDLLRSNLVTKIIDALFSKIFHSYNYLKYVISYPKDLKALIIENVIEKINEFVNHKIQNYSFALILNKLIDKVQPESIIQHYSVKLLKSFIEKYVFEDFIDNPFSIKEVPVIALDTYSLNFCTEILRDTSLNEELYDIVENFNIPDSYKEKIVQIIDNQGLPIENLIYELKDSEDLLSSWRETIIQMKRNYGRDNKSISTELFIDYCKDFIKDNSDLSDENLKKGVAFLKNSITNSQNVDSDKKVDLIKFYEKESNLAVVLKSLKEIGKKKGNKIFGNSTNYKKLKSMTKVLIIKQLKKDKRTLSEMIDDLELLVNLDESKKLEELLIRIKNFSNLLKDKSKLKKVENQISQVINFERIKKLCVKLESLDNSFLKLPKYNHIKGLIKTILSEEPLVIKSEIQYEYNAHNILLEALIDVYAYIYEDYFGRFSFRDEKKFLFSDVKVSINPGRMYEIQYLTAKRKYFFFNGINRIKNLFETIKNYENKFDYLNFGYAINELIIYSKVKGFKKSKHLFEYFFHENNLYDFFDYLLETYCNDSSIKVIKEGISKLYTNLKDYINGKNDSIPKVPKNILFLKSKELDMIYTILDNINKKNREYFIQGNHSSEDHISNSVNLRKLTDKNIENLIDDLDNLKDYLEDDISYLKKKISFAPTSLRSQIEIINEIHNDLKNIIQSFVDRHSLNEYDFEDINKIRIMSLLNTTKNNVPLDIKMYLINDGRYNEEIVRKLIKNSTKISDLFKMIINSSLTKDTALKKMLNTKLLIYDEKELIFPYKLKLLPEISSENKTLIFGDNAVFEDSVLIGFKVNLDEDSKNIYEQIIKAKVNKKISKELHPLIKILNRYSREIHTGFEKVHQNIFE